ncbi:hypothetical protein J4Q44_G00171250 [Coregonus suidteri]|uniref:Uncharacterized protein n=1 Tax=Coregonus suidteri TaxID=861788 RepID=A0AAN8M3N6_9TELE
MNPFLWSPFESPLSDRRSSGPGADLQTDIPAVLQRREWSPSPAPHQPRPHAKPQHAHRQVDTVLMETPRTHLSNVPSTPLSILNPELNRLNLESSQLQVLISEHRLHYVLHRLIRHLPGHRRASGDRRLLLSKQVQNKTQEWAQSTGGSTQPPQHPVWNLAPGAQPRGPLYLQNYSHSGSGMDLPPPGVPPKKSVARISQAGTKSVFAQSGNSREVIPVPFNQTQTTAPPQTRYEEYQMNKIIVDEPQQPSISQFLDTRDPPTA